MIFQNDIPLFYEPYRILEKAADYLYVLPHPGLCGLISNYTLTFPSRCGLSDDYTVIPHGCATLVFSASAHTRCGILFGPATLPCSVGAQANRADMLLIIEFQPAGLSAVTGLSQKELADHTFPFEMIHPALNKGVLEWLDKARGVHELLSGLDRLLLSALRGAFPPELRLSVEQVIYQMGNVSVKALSDSVYYSQRHLNRIFDRYVGMSPKTFTRLVRINQAVRLLRNPHSSLTNACTLCGFYDLPHFIHDFKTVCGIAPQEYRGRMSDFYNEIAKF